MYDHIGHLMDDYDQNAQAIEEIVYNGERPMVDVRHHGLNLYSIETEPNMTPIRVIDSSNKVIWSWENHEPFGYSDPVEGIDTVTGQPFEFNLRFPGQYFDTETGFVSNGYRDYSPLLGRYLEIDPLGLNAGMNPYGYVGGSPLDYVDPSGLKMIVNDERKGMECTNCMPQDYVNTINYLKENSPYANNYISDLEKSPYDFYVTLKDVPPINQGIIPDDSHQRNRVSWIPGLGYYARCLDNKQHYYNPAILLFHELDHFASNNYWWPAPWDPNYGNSEEHRVITGAEAIVYKQLTGQSVIRATHGGDGSGDMGWIATSSTTSLKPTP